LLASAAAIALGAFLAAGQLAGHHSAAPSVTHSANPDPTPSDSYPPWGHQGWHHHHGWKQGDGNGNGNGDGGGG